MSPRRRGDLRPGVRAAVHAARARRVEVAEGHLTGAVRQDETDLRHHEAVGAGAAAHEAHRQEHHEERQREPELLTSPPRARRLAAHDACGAQDVFLHLREAYEDSNLIQDTTN